MLEYRIIKNLLDQLDELKERSTPRANRISISIMFHDPGSRNTCLPLAEYGRAAGALLSTVDLRALAAESKKPASECILKAVDQAPADCNVFVFGCSTNRVERIGIAAANARGARTIQIIDAPGLCSRLDNLASGEMADVYLLSLETMVADLAAVAPAAAGRGIVCGSTHLEKCLLDAAKAQSGDKPGGKSVDMQALAAAGYFDGICSGIGNSFQVISFFMAPEELTIDLQR
jgi:hypothetical protein